MVNFIEKGISNIADFAGFVPVVSTITGLMRIIYGIAKQKFNEYRLSCCKDERIVSVKFSNEIKKGKQHVKLGKLEVIPFAKLIMLAKKSYHESRYEKID